MCGLVGGTLYDADTVEAALRQIDHRGRDATASVHYAEAGLWLGHNRLAIQGLGTGADQPLERGDASVVFNGELWRRSMGAHPEYTSDTVLLADLYRQSGGDAVAWARSLDGMFAVAVYDRRLRRVVLARDWLGRVPLYYVRDGRGIAFASEAKALTTPLGYRFAGSAPRARARSEVKLFPAGCVATYSPADGHFEVVPFRDFESYKEDATRWDVADHGEGYYVRGIRERLEAAVANETISDVPVCTILSGGVDSTIVTALLTRHVPGLRAYTVSVGEGNGKDDLAFARRAAEEIGVPLTEVILDRDEVVHALEEAVWAVEDTQWMVVAAAVPQIALARRIGADGYKVVFGGEGSDEIFGSYDNVRRWTWRPQQYHDQRIKLCERLQDNNVIRGNKAMMWGGTVELRTPFLDRELVDFCLRIPTRYRSDRDGRGSIMKPLLRSAFRDVVSEGLIMRKKVIFCDGAHSSFLKDYKDIMKQLFDSMFRAE